jgi:hypothetical protein
MTTSDGIWVPSYYRRPHRFSWVRAAGGPQPVDWLVGAVLAVLVLGLCALARTSQHQVTLPTAVAATTATQDSNTNADRVAYVPSAVEK